MATVFGLDFGTTNSLASIVADGRAVALTDLEDRPYPSVVLFRGEERIVGRAAKDQLDVAGVGVIGDAVRSPKASLGSGRAIHVAGVARSAREIVALIIQHVRDSSASYTHELGMDEPLLEAVMTIPIDMDGRARRELRAAAADAGVLIRQFVHEPLAALYGYLRGADDWQRSVALLEGKLVLVFDWGGGTLDLTLCRVLGRTIIQIHNLGEGRIGGDVFDERLRHLVQDEHARRHGLESLERMPGAEAKLLNRCEQAKISLSSSDDATVFVPAYLDVDGEAADVEVTITCDQLEELSADIVADGMGAIDRLLALSGLEDSDIEMVLATGGMVEMPVIRRRLKERFGPVRVPTVTDGQQIISKGAAWIGYDEQPLRLAKPLEVMLASDHPFSMAWAEMRLPVRGEVEVRACDVFCVDPRDGFARFQFVRPSRPDRDKVSDERSPYLTLLLPVDAEAAPLVERLAVQASFDEDLVVTVEASSSLSNEKVSAEIHDLEFGLSLEGHTS